MADKEKAKKQVSELVEKYRKLADARDFGTYKVEENTKKDFIQPLFLALGWNVYNVANFDNASEVAAEEKVSKGRVDYALRINGIPKFFLEAKALTENLDEPKFARQAIDYSYLKGCTWAVLTNFESVKIFNAEWKTTELVQSHFMTMHCHEFSDRFEDLWLLSEESFQKSLLDKAAERWGKKSKKSPVGEQLLADFTQWRERLSKNISTRPRNQSKHLSGLELDEAVQRIIDRLIFIRNCEDRGLEERKLLPTVREWENNQKGMLVERIKGVFDYFIREYDSELFAEALCDQLEISNEVLQEIINGLYNTKDKIVTYDFSAIEADVLGSVYEQYLSHILKKIGKGATLTEEQAHRKEQGIYYTPTYIVDYIVRNTLGELLNGTKRGADTIRVLDPACGSGSFLIKAFDVLDEFCGRAGKSSVQAKLGLGSSLPFTTKVQVLKNNIFGVDLDKQAVEITRLNLLLKVAERKQILPTLEESIRCGDSLIDDETVAGDKAFKWNDKFEGIMKEGGFDVVIGNPPYVRQEELSEIKPYLEANYETYQGTADLFVYFFEKELKLLKEDGYFGMVVSNKWLRAGYGKNLRKFLTGFWIEEFIDFGDLKVFADATIYPCIIIMRKIKKPNPKIRICNVETLGFGSLGEYVRNNSFFINQNELSEKEWNIQREEANELLKKLRTIGLPLEEYVGAKIYRGILTGLNEAFIIDEKKKEELILEDSRNEQLIKPFLTGAEIKRYIVKSHKNYVILTKIGVEVKKYQAVYRHLYKFKEALEKRWDKGNYWYELRACAYYDLFGGSKIVWGNLATRSSFSLDEKNGFYVNAPACILPTNSKYVLGILNSKLMSYFLKSICAERQGGFIEQKPVYVSQVPIKKPTKTQESEITKLVEIMLQLNEKLLEIGDKLTDERARIEEEIKKTDSEIDELVYKIYGITEEEKRIIEEAVSSS